MQVRRCHFLRTLFSFWHFHQSAICDFHCWYVFYFYTIIISHLSTLGIMISNRNRSYWVDIEYRACTLLRPSVCIVLSLCPVLHYWFSSMKGEPSWSIEFGLPWGQPLQIFRCTFLLNHILQIMAMRMGKGAALFLWVFVCFTAFFVCQTALQACSRTVYAFSRDHGMSRF